VTNQKKKQPTTNNEESRNNIKERKNNNNNNIKIRFLEEIPLLVVSLVPSHWGNRQGLEECD